MKPVRIDFRDQIAKNKRDSFFLMFIIFAVFVLFGYVISLAFEPGFFFIIMIISIVISLSYIWISFYNSDKIAVASVGAKPASRERYKQYYNLVEGLTLASGLPMPKLYIMETSQINAFASGRDPENAVVCVTTGALEKLEKRELEGVLAHELGHVANYDIRYMTLATVMVGMIAIVSQIFLRSLWFRGGSDDRGKGVFILIGIVLAILAPIVVQLVQLSISRRREFAADASSVKFTRHPSGLIKALKKIKEDNSPSEHRSVYPQARNEGAKISKALAPLFFANPFKGLGSTHPPIEKRISALERM
ncbi:MAG: M48 family metallopeptidase [Nanoarchaeota archaeon]|nr:M48 family metallopeptidase [Nanoarchaeota archaeon]